MIVKIGFLCKKKIKMNKFMIKYLVFNRFNIYCRFQDLLNIISIR